MYGIFITDMDMISNIGIGVEEIWDNLSNKGDINYKKSPIEIPLIISKSKIRRMSRYGYMGLYTTKTILDRREQCLDIIDKKKVGTIYNTAYGPFVSRKKFGECVSKHDADLASPTLFSQIVSNSCVGGICINTGLKGPSTILMGSNNIGYSFELIKEGKADIIFTGGIEEYCEELYASHIKKNEKRSDINIKLAEASATILLEKIDYSSDKLLHIKDKIYCEVLGYKERTIGVHPLMNNKGIEYDSAIFEKNMNRLVNDCNINLEDIDMIVTAQCGYKNIDLAEDKAISKLFGNDICKIAPRKIIGETLGAALTSNVIIAAGIIKNQQIPLKLCGDFNKEIKYVIVNSYDISGNLTSILLKRYNEGE